MSSGEKKNKIKIKKPLNKEPTVRLWIQNDNGPIHSNVFCNMEQPRSHLFFTEKGKTSVEARHFN